MGNSSKDRMMVFHFLKLNAFSTCGLRKQKPVELVLWGIIWHSEWYSIANLIKAFVVCEWVSGLSSNILSLKFKRNGNRFSNKSFYLHFRHACFDMRFGSLSKANAIGMLVRCWWEYIRIHQKPCGCWAKITANNVAFECKNYGELVIFFAFRSLKLLLLGN